MDLGITPEWVGYVAGLFTTIAYIPQTIKVLREKHTKSISIGMYAMISLGIGLWVLYGLLLGSPSLVVCNSISLTMAVFILFMKVKHG